MAFCICRQLSQHQSGNSTPPPHPISPPPNLEVRSHFQGLAPSVLEVGGISGIGAGPGFAAPPLCSLRGHALRFAGAGAPRTTTHSALIDKSARCCLGRRRCGLCGAGQRLQPRLPGLRALPRSLPHPGSAASSSRSPLPCRPMSAAPAYNEDKAALPAQGARYGHDPASGGIFSSDYKR